MLGFVIRNSESKRRKIWFVDRNAIASNRASGNNAGHIPTNVTTTICACTISFCRVYELQTFSSSVDYYREVLRDIEQGTC